LIGENGTGKTTTIQKIHEVMHGQPKDDVLLIVRRHKKIILNFPYGRIFDIKQFAAEYNEVEYITNQDDFIINDIITGNAKEGIAGKNLCVAYYSDQVDYSIKRNEHFYGKNFAINFSPFAVLSNPNQNLDFSRIILNSLAKNVNNFELITKINEIKYLGEFYNSINFEKPEQVFIGFDAFETNILNRYNDDYFNKLHFNLKSETQELFSGKNKWENVLNVHLIFSLQKVLDLTNPIYNIYFEKKKLEEYEDKIKTIFTTFSLEKNVTNLKGNIEKIINEKAYIENLSKNVYKIILNDIVLLFHVYIKLRDAYKSNYPNHLLSLEEASDFLENYLILRDKTDVEDYTTFFMPNKIDYMKNDEDFYFSTGQSSFLRLFTSINQIKNRLVKELTVEAGYKKDEKKLVLLLLDEPNNAMHPNMQREFISNLVDYLNSPMFDNFEFQVFITTHSPIITGDLTSNHVIRLKKENGDIRVDKGTENKTFAQNIYTLYKDSFYMKDGLIGKYAEKIIGDVQTSLEKEDNSSENLNDIIKNEYTLEDMEHIIEEIGEPIIRKHFENMLEEKIRDCDSEKCLKEIIESSKINPEKKERLLKELED
jgi:hypothetical protein